MSKSGSQGEAPRRPLTPEERNAQADAMHAMADKVSADFARFAEVAKAGGLLTSFVVKAAAEVQRDPKRVVGKALRKLGDLFDSDSGSGKK